MALPVTLLTPTQGMNLDVRQIDLPDHPAEWPVVTAEQRRALIPRNGYYTPAQDRLLRQIAAQRWFLLRNNGPRGEAWRCARCQGIHRYFTLHCVERPFNGLSHALGVMMERIDGDDVFQAVELGVIEPITGERATALYHRLRGLGYPPRDILGARS